MRVSFERRLSYLTNQLIKSWIVRKVRAQHQCIDEKPNQSFDLGPVAIGNRRTYQNVFLVTVAVKQHVESGQQNHIERGIRLMAQLLELLHEFAWKHEGSDLATIGLHCRSWSIGWKFKHAWCAFKLFSPVSELRL